MSWIFTALAVAMGARQIIKEKTAPVIPASYSRNKALMYEDQVVKCISPEQFAKNRAAGKYYLPDEPDANMLPKKTYVLDFFSYWREMLNIPNDLDRGYVVEITKGYDETNRHFEENERHWNVSIPKDTKGNMAKYGKGVKCIYSEDGKTLTLIPTFI